jgi:hypothetical protein
MCGISNARAIVSGILSYRLNEILDRARRRRFVVAARWCWGVLMAGAPADCSRSAGAFVFTPILALRAPELIFEFIFEGPEPI